MIRLIKKVVLLIFIAGGSYCLYGQFLSDRQPSPYIVSNVSSLKGRMEETRYSNHLADDPFSILVLVNKQFALEEDFRPSDLVTPNVLFSEYITDEEKYLRKEAAIALEHLFDKGAEQGFTLIATSGYRSYETQKRVYQDFVKQLGIEAAEYRAAQPGNSEHQTGLAMDITSTGFNYQEYQHFGEAPGGQWVAENAHHFGFIIRYPEGKEHITGYQYEPWHLRYVGVEEATYIFENQLTFEEYAGKL